MFTSEKRLYLTRDKSKVVEEGSEEAAFLLVAEGGQIPLAEAERLGLTKKPEEKAAEKPAATKAVPRPPATKGR